jgi:hypothetical protein
MVWICEALLLKLCVCLISSDFEGETKLTNLLLVYQYN